MIVYSDVWVAPDRDPAGKALKFVMIAGSIAWFGFSASNLVEAPMTGSTPGLPSARSDRHA